MLTRDEFYRPQAVAIIRLLLLTGCRFGEIAGLQWDWIKGRRIHIPDAKAGPRPVWLCSAARALIDDIPRYSPDCPFVFPGRPADRPVQTIACDWYRIREEAGLSDVRLHDLRHSWASTAAMHGVDMVTGRQACSAMPWSRPPSDITHLSDASISDAADRVSGRIQEALAGRGAGQKGKSNHADG